MLALPAAVLPSAAYAQTGNVPGAAVSGGSLLQGLLGLILVIALLWVVLHAMKRFGGAAVSGQAPGLRILSALPVGARERIVLLEVEDAWLVVGISPAGMRTLHSMPRGSLPEPPRAPGAPFAAWLKQISERRRNDR